MGSVTPGDQHGRLTAIRFSYWRTSPNGTKHSIWWFRCQCGTEKESNAYGVQGGKTVSCGCYRRTLHLTHGMEHTPEYKVWCAMKSRCLRPKDKAYPNYGGRGVMVCDRWLDFANFIADMGRRPPGRMTIERLENDKGYEPGNCKWATYSEQAKNHRKSARNTSGFVGVSKDKNRWEAYIKINGKRTHIGNYETKEAAAAARREVARQNGFKTDIGEAA